MRWLALMALVATVAHGWQQRRVRRDPLVQQRLNIAPPNAFGGPPEVAGPGIHDAWDGRLTAAAVRDAVEDATLFLRAQQTPDGGIGEGSYYAGGATALSTLALLAAGADPASDDPVQRALEWLLKLETDNVYVLGIRANVWEYALRKAPYEGRYRDALKHDFEALLVGVNEVAWRYTTSSRDWDNSCSQYGVLGIWAAERAGFRAGDAFWEKMSRHFREVQNPDGGWGYVQGSGSSANMATAGLASMFLVFDNHYGRKGYYRADAPRTFDRGPAAEVLDSIERGMQWLGKTERNSRSSYYLYGIERAGVASGRKYIGGVDWFAEGAAVALAAQDASGAISMDYGPVISTALSTLFLVYGGAPVAVNKLQYGESTAWNLNPRDASNLARHLLQAYERPLGWHIVGIDDPVEEFEAPILFVSGDAAPSLDDDQVAKLRAYVQRGGTILAEPADHAPAFAQGMETILMRMFPGSELAPLGAEHGIYTVVRDVPWTVDDTKRPRLRGASDGARTFFVLSDGYLGKAWQTNDLEDPAFALGMNLLFYATDLGALEGRFATPVPGGEPAATRPKVTVARVRHGGDWDAAAATWGRAAEYVKQVVGAPVVEVAPVDLVGAPRADLLHLSGRGALALTPGEEDALRAYVERGGTLLVDAWAGSPEFARTAREAVVRVFGELHPLDADDPLATGRFDGGEDLTRGVRFKLQARKALRRGGRSTTAHHLEVARAGGRVAVVFSAFDLSAALGGVEAYRAQGYEPDSARRVVANLVGYLRRG